MKRLIALLPLAVVSCSSSSSTQHVTFARLTFDLPADWQKFETSRRGISTGVWSPEGNAAKESIVVIRSELAPTLSHADASTFGNLLEQAQASLAEVTASPARAIHTAHGLSGIRVELDYRPTGLFASYHRVHVALIDGNSVIHVMYTAKEPDRNLTVLEAVLASIHEGEG